MNSEKILPKPEPDRRKRPRRRSFRAKLKVLVAVKWISKYGSSQEEATETKAVNSSGCLVLLKAKVSEGLSVELVQRNTKEVRKGRVTFCGAVELDGRTQVGVALEDPDPHFWGQEYVDFILATET